MRKRNKSMKATWGYLLVALTGLLSFSSSVLCADIDEQIAFDIPQTQAGDALNLYAQQAGVQLMYPYKNLQEIVSNGVKGTFTRKDALDHLLSDTGYAAEFSADGTITIQIYGDEGRSMKTRNKFLAALLSIFGATQVTGAVDTVEPDGVSEQSAIIEEVIVTARKREERLQEVPISISVFSAKDLEIMSLTSLKELGQFVPNLTFSNHASLGRSSAVMYIRGVGMLDPDVFGDPGVAIYRDGVYMGRAQGVDFDLADIERVEILRGPQGTLFGRNAIGGAVNVVTVKPTDEFYGSAEITTGRFDRMDGKLSVNVPLIPGKLAAKFSGATRNRDGYGKRLDFFTGAVIDEMSDQNSMSGKADFSWTPTDNFGVLLSIDGTRVREMGSVRKVTAYNEQAPIVGLMNLFLDPPFGNVFLTDNDFTNFANGANANNLDTWGIALTVDWDFDNWGIKSITSYRDMEALDGTDPDGSIYAVIDETVAINQNQFSQEIQVTGSSINNRLEWITGLYYFQEDGSTIGRDDVFRELKDIIGLDASFTVYPRAEAKSYAIFGQGTYSLTEKFSLTGGLRYTDEEKDVSTERVGHFSGMVIIPFTSMSESWDAVTGRAGLEYQWNDDVMNYVSVARGFKSGSINGRAVTLDAFKPYDPEYIWSYEAGLKSEWFDRRLRFNASIFYSDYSDIQFTVVRANPDTGVPTTLVDNAAKAKVKGFEIDLMAVPTQGLTLSAGVGYIDAKYTEVDPTLAITKDSNFLETPKWSVNLSGQYVIPIQDWGELVTRLDYMHKSKVYHNYSNSPPATQQEYGLLNARLSFEAASGKWMVSVFGTNIGDTRYILAGTDFLDSLGFAEVQYARPREWGMSFKYRF